MWWYDDDAHPYLILLTWVEVAEHRKKEQSRAVVHFYKEKEQPGKMDHWKTKLFHHSNYLPPPWFFQQWCLVFCVCILFCTPSIPFQSTTSFLKFPFFPSSWLLLYGRRGRLASQLHVFNINVHPNGPFGWFPQNYTAGVPLFCFFSNCMLTNVWQ